MKELVAVGDGVTVKTCSCCKKQLQFSDFYNQKDMRYGLRSYCKLCTKAKSAARYKANLEREYKNNARKRDELKDSYVLGLICHGTSIKRSEVSPDLIDLKRVQLQITRHLRESKKCQA